MKQMGEGRRGREEENVKAEILKGKKG